MKSKRTSLSIIRLDGICALCFLVLALLKITTVVTWSWWWITSPLWIPIALFGGISLFILLMAAIIVLPDFIKRRYIKKK